MDFISLDIAHMEPEENGFRYILLIRCGGCEQTIDPPTWDTKVYPVSNVDGNLFNEVCTSLRIEKRRTSGYHAQGNGFAERSIRNIREVLRTAQLDKGLDHKHW